MRQRMKASLAELMMDQFIHSFKDTSEHSLVTRNQMYYSPTASTGDMSEI